MSNKLSFLYLRCNRFSGLPQTYFRNQKIDRPPPENGEGVMYFKRISNPPL